MSKPSEPNATAGLEGEKPRCGLCGNPHGLTRTPCCGNWICDDKKEYVPFSLARNSCYRNHAAFTICAYHHQQAHEGSWQDCVKCRELGLLELYVHNATNEYNFQKLEHPPTFNPTFCSNCGVWVRLAYDQYSMRGGAVLCTTCGGNPFDQGDFEKAMVVSQKDDREGSNEGAFPIGTVAHYGPTNRVATKIAASVIRRPGAAPDPLHRWIIQSGGHSR